MFRDLTTVEGNEIRRFFELPLLRNESPALSLSWTLYHVIDEQSPLRGMGPEELDASDVSLVVVVSGYDVIAAQTVHARKSYEHRDILFGRRYVDVLGTSDDGRVRIDYGRFHDTSES
jgi:inward rectifier potassium channel